MKVEPYLYFAGDCEEAFKFYSETLRVPILMAMKYDGAPGSPPEFADKIMHTSLHIGSTLLMGSDAPPDRYSKPNGFSVSLEVDTPEEADRIYAELSAGGQIIMPIQETFWAERFAMFRDRFGTPWMVSKGKPMQ